MYLGTVQDQTKDPAAVGYGGLSYGGVQALEQRLDIVFSMDVARQLHESDASEVEGGSSRLGKLGMELSSERLAQAGASSSSAARSLPSTI